MYVKVYSALHRCPVVGCSEEVLSGQNTAAHYRNLCLAGVCLQ